MKRITKNELHKLLRYDNGVLYWNKDNGTNTKAGQRAGSVGGSGYRYIRVGTNKELEHRVVWLYHYGRLPRKQLDHINGNRSDNRIENLREVNQSQNNKNQKLRKDNTSGYRGVSRYKQTDTWVVKVGNGGKRVHGGYFKDLEQAILKRKELERELGYELAQRVA